MVTEQIVWVVTNADTFPETAVIAVFSREADAITFADSRNRHFGKVFYVHRQVIDQWVP